MMHSSPPTQSVLVSQLWKRYQRGLIYTYVGDILISINPFQKLDIYNEKVSGFDLSVNCQVRWL